MEWQSTGIFGRKWGFILFVADFARAIMPLYGKVLCYFAAGSLASVEAVTAWGVVIGVGVLALA